MYERGQVKTIVSRILDKNNKLIQIIVGPRQTGKSTMLNQALRKSGKKYIYKSADEAIVANENWLSNEWQQARNAITEKDEIILAIDEIQKVKNWASIVKFLYDEDRLSETSLKVVLSGSSSLLLQYGANESLMGRFEIIRSPHWTFEECETTFGFSLNDYLYFGGYPGAAAFKEDNKRWLQYMNDAIIQPTINQDVLSLEPIRKPALMSNLFKIGASYSGQEISYNKMLGQLQDSGNTTIIASYLDILKKNNILCGINKFSRNLISQKRSSPKLLVYDTSLMTATIGQSYEETMRDRVLVGRITESAIGAHLLKLSAEQFFDLTWYRKNNKEVDFILSKNDKLIAIEVKSGNQIQHSGMQEFLKNYPKARRIVISNSSQGSVSVSDFLKNKIELF